MWSTPEENFQWSSQSSSQTVPFASIHKCSWLPPATLRLPLLSSVPPPPPSSPCLPIIRSQMKWQWEEMFTMKLVVSSLESVMQATEGDINAIHHTIDSCRIKDSNSQPKGYLDKKSLLVWNKLLFLDNSTIYCTVASHSTIQLPQL